MAQNILFIIADQLTPLAMGAYGNPIAKTPNLDRLAEQSTRFDAAYTPVPLCSPARASMCAGQYGSRIGAYDNSSLFPADVPTYAHYLTNMGYDVVASGKMHFIGPDQLHGHRARLTTNIYPADFSWVRSRAWENKPVSFPDRLGPAYEKGGPDNGHGMGRRRWNWHLEYDERTHCAALEYLRRQVRDQWYEGADTSVGANERPFFLSVSYHHPHQPFQVPQKYWDLYEGVTFPIPEIPEAIEETWSQLDRWLHYSHGLDKKNIADPANLQLMYRCYYGLISYIDDLVGELLTALDDLALADSTLVVFASDHGEMLGTRGMIQKRCFYEQSARVPLLIRKPGHPGGVVVSDPVSLVDLMPTFADVAGYPAADMHRTDGLSLMPYFDGETRPDRAIFAEQHSDGVYGPCFMIRKGRFKYTYVHGYDAQLFDIEADPDEWTNLSGRPEHAETEAGLRALVLETFDPDTIERDIALSIDRRLVIEGAMKLNDTSWDYLPTEDVTRIYNRQRHPAPEAALKSPQLAKTDAARG